MCVIRQEIIAFYTVKISKRRIYRIPYLYSRAHAKSSVIPIKLKFKDNALFRIEECIVGKKIISRTSEANKLVMASLSS